jgi:hypothetical protein
MPSANSVVRIRRWRLPASAGLDAEQVVAVAARVTGLERTPAGFERRLRDDGARVDAELARRGGGMRQHLLDELVLLLGRHRVSRRGSRSRAAGRRALAELAISMSARPRPLPCDNCTASWSSIMPWYMSPWSLPNIGSPKLALRMLSSIILVKMLSNWRATSRRAADRWRRAPRRKRRELPEVGRARAWRARSACQGVVVETCRCRLQCHVSR